MSSTGLLFNNMTDSQIGKITRLISLIYSDSLCTLTNLGEELGVLKPPCEALGPFDYLDEFCFILSNYENHHELGILGDQLVQEGILLDAGTAVEDVRQRDEAADQKHSVVDLVMLE
jgi:hypothetical protein